MDTVKIKALGMEGNGLEPSSVEEFDQIAKKTGTCLQRAREYVRFHITLGDIRELFLHGQKAEPAAEPPVEGVTGVEEASGIARKTKPVVKDGKPVIKDGEPVTEYDETESKYFDRVVATLVENKQFANEDEARASFQPLFDQCIRVVGFPAQATQRKSAGPKKLAAKYKQSAAVALTRGTVERINANQLTAIGKSFTPSNDTSKMFQGTASVPTADKNEDGSVKYVEVTFNVSDKDAEALGWLIKEYFDWKADQERLAVVG